MTNSHPKRCAQHAAGNRRVPAVAICAGMLLVGLLSGVRAAWSQESANRFDITALNVVGNTVLSTAQIDDAVYEFLGTDRSYDDVEAARVGLEAAYHARGYMTVAVIIPEQTVANGLVRLEVIEQKVGELRVAGSTPGSEDEIRALAPSLRAGAVPNFQDLERDVVALNRSADRRVTPDIQAGKQAGTVDVELKVEERLPLHATVELNDRGSANTTDLRAMASLSHSNLWGRGDIASLSVQTAPDREEDAKVYSGSYIGWLPGHSHQFLVYGVKTQSDVAVVGEDLSVLGRGSVIGARWIIPFAAHAGLYHSLSWGLDYKDFKEDVVLGADSNSAPIQYAPLILKYQASWRGDQAQTDLDLAGAFGLRPLSDDRQAFSDKRFDARPNFFTLGLELTHTYSFKNDIQLFGKLAGQLTQRPLISNEQFSIGGADTARGYFESEALGDYGFAAQLEARSPSFAAWLGSWMDELRVYAFADGGAVRIHEPLPEQEDGRTLLSAGAGLRFQAFGGFFGSYGVARPLRSGPSTLDADELVTFFRVWGEM